MTSRRALLVGFALLLTAAAPAEDPTWKKAFLLTRAGDAYAKGHFPEAAKLFASVLQFDGDDETALLHLGAMAKKDGKLKDAAIYFGRGATAHPTSFPLQEELGGVLLSLGKPAEAAEHFKAASLANPKSLDALVNWGDALSLSGRREEAWAPYASAVALDATSTWARRQAGFCAFDTGRLPEAIEHLTLAAPAFPKDFNVPLVIGHAQAKLGNDATALAAYQKATALAPKSEQGPLFAGATLERMGRLPDALKSLERAVALKPDSDVPHVHLGNLYRRLKQNDRARQQYALAIKVSPKSVWALMQLGFMELEAGQAAKAKKLLQQAVALEPNNADVGIALGDAYQLLHQDPEALKAYRQTLVKHPGNLSALVKTADVLSRSKPDEALGLYRQAAKLYPKSAWARISLGDALRLKGELAAAKEQYLAALEADPQSSWAQRQLGYASFELEDFAEAERLLAPLAANADADLLEVLGHLARKRGAYDEALAWYERARALAPQRPSVFLALADAQAHRNALPEAELNAHQALSLDTKYLDAWILLGDVKRRIAGATKDEGVIRAQLLGARDAYEHALALDPKHRWAQRQLATLAYELGDDLTAEKLLPGSRKAFPKDGELSLVAGHIATRAHSTEAARLAYLDATAQLPEDVRPWVFAARATLALERYAEADVLFVKALTLAPDSAWAHLERGFGQRARRDWAGALESATKATSLDAKNANAWLFLGRLHQERNHLDPAIDAYEHASALAPNDPLTERALASALTHKGQVEGLLRAETLLVRPLKALGGEGFTHAVAGYVMVKLARTLELQLPAPTPPQTRVKRRAIWNELGAFHLQQAVKMTPNDRNIRLASAVGLFELERFEEARKVVTPLLDAGGRQCPKEEWSWKWNAYGEPRPPDFAQGPEQVLALQDEQLRSEAHLLAGDLSARDNPGAARLSYFCALVWLPWRADAHLRLGASYEAMGLTRLSEEHYLAAQKLDPTSAPALASLARIRKEGGIQLGPVRVSGATSFNSETVPGDVQARLARSTNALTADTQRALLTTPRTLAIGAETTWQRPQWESKLRLGLGYSFAWGFNAFLNDQLTFEDRRSHQVDAFASGRPILFDDRRFDVWWRAGYRLVVANATTRSELRNGLTAEARVLRDGWGTADAELSYALGLFTPGAAAPIADPVAHGLIFGVRVSPLLRKYEVELSVGYRGQFAALAPSKRALWVNELSATGRKTWEHFFVGGDLRLGHSSDAPWASTAAAIAFSVMLRGNAGYKWNGYSGVSGRAGLSLVPGMGQYDSLLIGAQGEHRFVFQGFGSADQGLSLSAAYDVRYTYGLQRVEHLFTAVVTLGR